MAGAADHNDCIIDEEQTNEIKNMLVVMYTINNIIMNEEIPDSKSIDKTLKEILTDRGDERGGGARNKFRKKRGSSFIKTGGAKLDEINKVLNDANSFIELLRSTVVKMRPILLDKQTEIDEKTRGKTPEQRVTWFRGFFKTSKVNEGGENAIQMLKAAVELLIKLSSPDESFDITEEEIAGLIGYIPANFVNREDIVRELTFVRHVIAKIHEDRVNDPNHSSIEAVAASSAASQLILGSASALGLTGQEAANFELTRLAFETSTAIQLQRLKVEEALINSNKEVALEGLHVNERLANRALDTQISTNEQTLKANENVNKAKHETWLKSLGLFHAGNLMNIRITYIIMILGISASLLAGYFSYNNGPLMTIFGETSDMLISWSNVDLSKLFFSEATPQLNRWLSLDPFKVVGHAVLKGISACLFKGLVYVFGFLIKQVAAAGSFAVSFVVTINVMLGTIAVQKLQQLRSVTATAVSAHGTFGSSQNEGSPPPPFPAADAPIPTPQIAVPQLESPSQIGLPPGLSSHMEGPYAFLLPPNGPGSLGFNPQGLLPATAERQLLLPPSESSAGQTRQLQRNFRPVSSQLPEIVPEISSQAPEIVSEVPIVSEPEPDKKKYGGSRKRSASKRTRRKGKQPSKKLKRKSCRYVRRRQSTRRKN